VKDGGAKVHAEGWIPDTRCDLDLWMKTLPQPWSAAMEATIFTGLDLRSSETTRRSSESGR
jgi:hypothetical protein